MGNILNGSRIGSPSLVKVGRMNAIITAQETGGSLTMQTLIPRF